MILSELELFNLNKLHVVKKCGTCRQFNNLTGRCKKFNRIHESNAIAC